MIWYFHIHFLLVNSQSDHSIFDTFQKGHSLSVDSLFTHSELSANRQAGPAA